MISNCLEFPDSYCEYLRNEILRKGIWNMHNPKGFQENAPMIRKCDDGSLLLEWVSSQIRFGITVEEDGRVAWYLASKDGVMDCYGDIKNVSIHLKDGFYEKCPYCGEEENITWNWLYCKEDETWTHECGKCENVFETKRKIKE